MFSHPGIARLVSAFRWRDGAYLVLEYASRGDLHSHVKEHGSLSEASTRLEYACIRKKMLSFMSLVVQEHGSLITTAEGCLAACATTFCGPCISFGGDDFDPTYQLCVVIETRATTFSDIFAFSVVWTMNTAYVSGALAITFLFTPRCDDENTCFVGSSSERLWRPYAASTTPGLCSET